MNKTKEIYTFGAIKRSKIQFFKTFLTSFVVLAGLSLVLSYSLGLYEENTTQRNLINNQNRIAEFRAVRISERMGTILNFLDNYAVTLESAINEQSHPAKDLTLTDDSVIKMIKKNKPVSAIYITTPTGKIISGVQLVSDKIFQKNHGTLEEIYKGNTFFTHKKEYQIGFAASDIVYRNDGNDSLMFLVGKNISLKGKDTVFVVFEVNSTSLLEVPPLQSSGYIIVTDRLGQIIKCDDPNYSKFSKNTPLLTLDEYLRNSGVNDNISLQNVNSEYPGELTNFSFSKNINSTDLKQNGVNTETELLGVMGWEVYIYLPLTLYNRIVHPFTEYITSLWLLIIFIQVLIASLYSSIKVQKNEHLQMRQLAEKQSRLLFLENPIGLALVNPKSLEILDGNVRFKEIFGIKKGQTANVLISDFINVDYEKIEWVITGKTEKYTCEKQTIFPYSSPKWLSVTISKIDDVLFKKSLLLTAFEDVTETKTSRIELERFRTALDQSSDRTFLFDADGETLLDVNLSTITLLGYTVEQLKNLNSGNISPALSQEALKEFVANFSADGRKYNSGISFLLTASGEKIPVEFNFTVAEIDGIKHIVVTARDITWRLQYEAQVVKNQKNLDEAQALAKIGSWTIDVATKNVTWSKEMYKLLGYPPDSDLSEFSDIGKFVHPDDLLLVTNLLMRRMLVRDSAEITFRSKRADGSYLWTESVIKKVPGPHGSIKQLVGTLQDVSYRKENELLQDAYYKITELISTDLALDDIFTQIHAIVRTLLYADNFYIALYDKKSETISFPYFRDTVDAFAKTQVLGRGLTAYVIRTGKSQLLRQKDKEILYQSGEIEVVGSLSKVWLGVPLKINTDTIGAMVVQNYINEKSLGEREEKIFKFVSEQVAMVIAKRQKDEELKKYSKELMQSNSTKERLLSLLAHDLRSPYTSLLGISDILLNEYEELTEAEKKDFLLKLNIALHGQYDLLSNLLQWIMLQTERIVSKPVKVNVMLLAMGNRRIFAETAAQKGIQLRFDIDPEINIYADEGMMNTIFRNLISNSIKFTPLDGVISISATKAEDKIQIVFKDTGVGMKKELVQRLFVESSTYSSKGTGGEQGTGFGLILVKEMVEKQGATLQIESEEGKGSEFIITFPQGNGNLTDS